MYFGLAQQTVDCRRGSFVDSGLHKYSVPLYIVASLKPEDSNAPHTPVCIMSCVCLQHGLVCLLAQQDARLVHFHPD